ncbi:membrane protein insertion efficiency factor YidD [Patescibacteria group bacterium]
MTAFSQILVWIIKGYQKTLSPDHGILFSHLYPQGCCKFYPSCSQYASQAISRFGVAKGFWLATKRVLRCSPIGEGGVDDVPSK